MKLRQALGLDWLRQKAFDVAFDIYKPWEWVWGIAGQTSASGAVVSPKGAMQLSTYYACVAIIAQSLAASPLIPYERLPQGRGRKRAEAHWIQALLTAPNDDQTAFEFVECLVTHLLNRGNFFCMKVKDSRGETIALIPLMPDNVRAKRVAGRTIYEVYRNDTNLKLGDYTSDDILHVKGLSLNGWLGVSPLEYHRETVGTAITLRDHGARLFKNRAQPGGTLNHPASLSDKAYARLKDHWQKSYSGDNVGETAILEEGTTFMPLTMTNDDSQYLQTMEFHREEICSIMRVPPHKVGILKRSTNNNIEHQGIEFYTDCMLPMGTRIAQCFNKGLLGNDKNVFTEFLMDAVLRGDIKTRFAAYAVARQWGWASVNDIKAKENENPIEGGDVYLQPVNMVDASNAADLLNQPADNSGNSNDGGNNGN